MLMLIVSYDCTHISLYSTAWIIKKKEKKFCTRKCQIKTANESLRTVFYENASRESFTII